MTTLTVRCLVLLTGALTGALAIPAWAENQCGAAVTVKSQQKVGTSWDVSFNVTTQCNASTGRFVYTYRNDANSIVERQSPSWTSSDGSKFVLKDQVNESGGMRELKVKAGTIESTSNERTPSKDGRPQPKR